MEVYVSVDSVDAEEYDEGSHTYMSPRRLDTLEKPRAKFVFRYRDKPALQKQLILPRTPTPEHLAAMQPAELLRFTLEMYQRTKNIEVTPVKKERRTRDEDGEEEDSVKRHKSQFGDD